MGLGVLGLGLSACTQAGPGTAGQQSLMLPIAQAGPVETQKVLYHCAGPQALLRFFPQGTVVVEYTNAGAIHLATLSVERKPLVFANVIVASGAKYMADNFVWWTKGDTALFTTQTQNPTEQLICEAQTNSKTQP